MCAVTAVSCSSGVNESAAPEGSELPRRPELTQVTSSMYVDRSAVPNSAAMEFAAPDISRDIEGTSDPVDPPECAPIYWGPAPTEAGSVSWSSTTSPGTSTKLKLFNLFLAVSAERPEFTTLLGKCRTIEYQGLTPRSSPFPCLGCPVGQPQRGYSRQGLAALASLAFAVASTYPWPSLKARRRPLAE